MWFIISRKSYFKLDQTSKKTIEISKTGIYQLMGLQIESKEQDRIGLIASVNALKLHCFETLLYCDKEMENEAVKKENETI